MILFDLRCKDGHGFEAWFRDSAAYDDQVCRRRPCLPGVRQRRGVEGADGAGGELAAEEPTPDRPRR